MLVVDDDHGVRELFSTVLTREGYEVTTVPDVYSALAFIRGRAPDLLVADADGDHEGGLWLLSAVRVQYADLPVVMMGAQAPMAPDRLHRALSLGASDTLLKPLDEQRVCDAVRRLVEPRTDDRRR